MTCRCGHDDTAHSDRAFIPSHQQRQPATLLVRRLHVDR